MLVRMSIPLSILILSGMITRMDAPARPSLRLTRDERRAQTRERLLEAALDVFNRLGYHGASLEAVAEAAGFTKGAVYSNFASKAELFVALAERRSASAVGLSRERLERMSIADFVDTLGAALRSQVEHEESWDVLTIEVWLAAMRDPALREIVARDYREMRAALGPVIAERLAEAGLSVPFDGAELATLASALGSGLILQFYLDPSAVDPSLLPRALRRIVGLPVSGEGR